MTIDRRLLAGMLGIALVAGACGGSGAGPAASEAPGATEAPAVTDAPAATDAPEATEAPAETDAPEATEDSGSNGSGNGPLNDLASRLPEQAGGVTFERVGFDGSQFGMYGAMAGLSDEDFNGILKQSGKTLSDVNFAIATPSGDQAAGGFIYAIQVEGLGTDQVMAAFGFDPAEMTTTTIAGKEVYSTGEAGFGVTAYAKDDTLYLILFASPDVTKAILEQLP